MSPFGLATTGAATILGFFYLVIYPDLEYAGGTSTRSCTGECYAEYVRQFGTPAEMERRKQALAAGDQFSSIRSLWAGCAACHGQQGEGMAVFPALVGKDKQYIVDRLNAYKNKEEVGSMSSTMWGQAALDVIKSWAGKQTFQKYFNDINRDKTQFMENQKIARDEAAAANPDGKLTAEQVEFFDKEMRDGLDWFENVRTGLASQMDSTTDLQIKAKLKTTELLTSYALANLLKNEDRLAVQDIKRAEEATKLFGPLVSPEMAIAKYLTLEKNLTDAIANDMKIANTLGIQNDQIVAYDEGYTLTQSGSTEEKTFRKKS